MSRLTQFTNPGSMVAQLRGTDATTVIAELCSTLQRQGLVPNSFPLYNTVIKREALSSTAISPGWALPHARINGIPRLAFALGRTTVPLAWVGGGGPPVDLVFLFAVPETESATYLVLISALAKISGDKALVEGLLQARDGQAMFDVLEQIPLGRHRPVAVRA